MKIRLLFIVFVLFQGCDLGVNDDSEEKEIDYNIFILSKYSNSFYRKNNRYPRGSEIPEKVILGRLNYNKVSNCFEDLEGEIYVYLISDEYSKDPRAILINEKYANESSLQIFRLDSWERHNNW